MSRTLILRAVVVLVVFGVVIALGDWRLLTFLLGLLAGQSLAMFLSGRGLSARVFWAVTIPALVLVVACVFLSIVPPPWGHVFSFGFGFSAFLAATLLFTRYGPARRSPE